jgi:hypothetical protein
VARARFPAVAAELQAYFEQVRQGASRRSPPEQCEAIAGEIYAWMLKDNREKPFKGFPPSLFWGFSSS